MGNRTSIWHGLNNENNSVLNYSARPIQGSAQPYIDIQVSHLQYAMLIRTILG